MTGGSSGLVAEPASAAIWRALARVASPACTLQVRTDRLVTLLIDDVELPREVATAIDAYLAVPSVEVLCGLQRAIVRHGQGRIEIAPYLKLVAELVTAKVIHAEDAAAALASVPDPDLEQLDPTSRELVETAKHVVHDQHDGVMRVDDDDTFDRALRAYVTAHPGRDDV